jgi:hypothetical protein
MPAEKKRREIQRYTDAGASVEGRKSGIKYLGTFRLALGFVYAVDVEGCIHRH